MYWLALRVCGDSVRTAVLIKTKTELIPFSHFLAVDIASFVSFAVCDWYIEVRQRVTMKCQRHVHF